MNYQVSVTRDETGKLRVSVGPYSAVYSDEQITDLSKFAPADLGAWLVRQYLYAQGASEMTPELIAAINSAGLMVTNVL